MKPQPPLNKTFLPEKTGCLPGSLMPAQASMLQGGRMSTLSAGRTSPAPMRPPVVPTLVRPARAADGPLIPQL